jgi:electron transport complex protein RnfG
VKKFIEESWLVLTMGVVFALLLAVTQTSFSAKIAENQKRALVSAIDEVVPNCASSEPMTVDGDDVYKCLGADGSIIGWAVETSGTGFIDKITLVVGLSPDAKTILGIKVIQNSETPGLGNKIESKWADQYADLDATRKIEVVKRPVNQGTNEVQAITGATWSSRYTTDIVNSVIERVGPKLAEMATGK